MNSSASAMHLLKMALKIPERIFLRFGTEAHFHRKVPPGATVSLACPASLLPCCMLTQFFRPFTTASLTPSFTYGDRLAAW